MYDKGDNRGITVIALIVFIIVLLIISGTVILTISDEKGIVAKGQSAVDKTKQATALEEMTMAWSNLKSEFYHLREKCRRIFFKYS